MESADSITIDPHKMGYVPYPCGAVAFRNDRIRHFILQRAPYITSVKQNVLVHMPPKRTEAAPKDEIDGKVIIEAFAPFIVEGSRPGAAACALWLATNLIPLTMRQHGAIIRASLLAARELFEWLSHWGTIMKRNGVDTEYEFVPLTRRTPGTNIVIFAVKRKTSSQLESMNELTRRVYQAFSIDVELGARDYSYSQPFFLSKTTCSSPEYGYETLRPIFDKWAIRNSRASYAQHGLTVLRATVMNPYIHPIRQAGNQNFIKEFMKELAAASKGASRALAVEEQ
jgi:hypothetical protein